MSNQATLRVELPDAATVRLMISKTGSERLAIAASMFRSARRMISSQLRNENPDWTQDQLAAVVAKRLSHGAR